MLQKYILKQYLLIYLVTMCFLQGVFVVVRTMEMIDVFLRTNSLTFKKLVLYYVYEMPFTLSYLFPIGTLFSIVLCLGRMNNSRELVALYNTGKSILYYLRPIIILLGITCTIFMIKDYEIYYRSHQIHMELHRNLVGRDFFAEETRAENELVQFGQNNKIYIVSTFLPSSKKILDTKVIYFDENYAITNISKIQRAEYLENGKWRGTGVTHRQFFIENGEIATKTIKAEEEILNLGDKPSLFKPMPHSPIHLSRNQVLKEAKRLEITGGDKKKWWTEYHSKIALPYISFVIFFLGIPLSSFSRRSVLGISFFLVLLLTFFYMTFYYIGISLGHTGVLPPIIAGWFGNIIFGTLAVVMYLRLQN